MISIQVRDLRPKFVWKSVRNPFPPPETRTQLRVNDDIPKCHFIVLYYAVSYFANAFATCICSREFRERLCLLALSPHLWATSVELTSALTATHIRHVS